MRIAHLVNDVDGFGNGIVNVVVDVACGESDAGHEVWVLSRGGEFEDLLADHGVTHVHLDQRRSVANLARAGRDFRRFVDRARPDVVHAHMVTGTLLARACRGRRRFLLAATLHNSWQRSSTLMAAADVVIAVSDAVRDELRRRHVPERKLRVVRNGPLDSPRAPRANDVAPASLARLAVVTVAGMYERKGIADLLDAFATVAAGGVDAHLYLVGDGPDRARFEARAGAGPVADRIHFEGFQAEPMAYLRAADVFVLASHHDPNPLVIPEARAAGCAIVASDAGGIVEALEQGRAGLLYPAGDAAALTTALRRLLTDDDERARWAKEAATGTEWLTVERVVAETLAVYAGG